MICSVDQNKEVALHSSSIEGGTSTIYVYSIFKQIVSPIYHKNYIVRKIKLYFYDKLIYACLDIPIYESIYIVTCC